MLTRPTVVAGRQGPERLLPRARQSPVPRGTPRKKGVCGAARLRNAGYPTLLCQLQWMSTYYKHWGDLP